MRGCVGCIATGGVGAAWCLTCVVPGRLVELVRCPVSAAWSVARDFKRCHSKVKGQREERSKLPRLSSSLLKLDMSEAEV